jgi:hypothetical protein
MAICTTTYALPALIYTVVATTAFAHIYSIAPIFENKGSRSSEEDFRARLRISNSTSSTTTIMLFLFATLALEHFS